MNSTAFLVDKYEITMLQAALESGAAYERGTFELFARSLPTGRRYGVVGGMARAVDAVRNFIFTEDQLAYLAQDPVIKESTIEYLRAYRFTGTVRGYREGDLYFPHSPVLTVEGTFGDSVLLETVLLSILNYDSAVASAASRMSMATRGRFPLIEMGSRRTHEAAAVAAARVAYIAGFNATSNMEAGLKYGVPTTGTSAHAFTLLHAEETDAFRAQIAALGISTTLLVDTYDIAQGIRNAVAVAKEFGAAGPGAIRIDSGDLHDEPANARVLLDQLGAHETKIVVSSDIDEFSIDELIDRNTPVDGVGAGTRVVTGSGHPTAKMVFKLVEREAPDGSMLPVAKKSASKNSIGGRKIAYRTVENNTFTGEYYNINGEVPAGAMPLQVTYLHDGETVFEDTIEEARERHYASLAMLADEAKTVSAGDAALEATLEEGALA